MINAYRAALGRVPENDAVITANLARSPATILGVIARSAEFRGRLRDIAAERLTGHALLAPDAVAALQDWAVERAGLPPDAPAGDGTRSAAGLLLALLRLPTVAGALAEAPEDIRAARDRLLATAPERLALHRLTRPATPEDARRLGLILAGREAAEPVGPVPLHQLLAAAIGAPAFHETVLRPLAAAAPLPVFGLGAEAAAGCATWLRERLGAEAEAPLPLGGLLAALLRLPAVDDMLHRAWPAEHPAAMGALPGLASGAQQLAATRATTEDVGLAYRAILGRSPESAAVRRAHEGAPIGALVSSLLASAEFRAHVLARLAGAGAVPHHGLTGEQRREIGRWLAARVGIPARPGAPAPLHPLALLARLLFLPALAGELQRQHGALWAEARDALASWLAEGRHGLLGAIDYVTGDWIAGWAVDRGDSAPVEVEIHCNGRIVALGRADRPRPGLSAEEDLGGADCGFRLAWSGRESATSRVAAEGTRRFQIVAARTGEPVGPAFELDSAFVEPRTTLQMLTLELRQARATLDRLERMLPQLESFTGFPPEEHASFRRSHRILPPPHGGDGAGITVLVPGRGVSVRGLRRIMEALRRQEGTAWTARLLTTTPEQAALAAGIAARDPRVTAQEVAETGEDSAAERAILHALPAGSLALLLPPGGMPGTPHALAWFAHAALRFPAAAGFCCDEDTALEGPGDRPDSHTAPVLRMAPDAWSLPGGNDGGDALCGRAEALAAALDHAQAVPDHAGRCWVAWAALVRAGPVVHIPRLLIARQAGEGEAAGTSPCPAPCPVEALAPLLPHPWLLPGRPPPPDDGADIAVIVPTRNGGPLLAEALASLRDTAAAPDRLQVLVVDNGSDRGETLAILEAEAARPGSRVLRLPEPFNWSRLNNLAAREATAGHLLFLNDDTRMLTRGWDRVLRALLAVPEVGAVGARLVYDDLTIQHAGVLFGVEGLVAHEGVGAAMEAGGPGGRWQRLRRAGAVTGAFLACRRAVFEASAGFDEAAFGVTFNDVDFCLRLRAAGRAVLYAPEIALVHYESKSRGIDSQDAAKQERAEFERRLLAERWGEGVLLDPGFNPHWSRWTRPFAALRDPSEAEILAHMAATARADPWNPAPG